MWKALFDVERDHFHKVVIFFYNRKNVDSSCWWDRRTYESLWGQNNEIICEQRQTRRLQWFYSLEIIIDSFRVFWKPAKSTFQLLEKNAKNCCIAVSIGIYSALKALVLNSTYKCSDVKIPILDDLNCGQFFSESESDCCQLNAHWSWFFDSLGRSHNSEPISLKFWYYSWTYLFASRSVFYLFIYFSSFNIRYNFFFQLSENIRHKIYLTVIVLISVYGMYIFELCFLHEGLKNDKYWKFFKLSWVIT